MNFWVRLVIWVDWLDRGHWVHWCNKGLCGERVISGGLDALGVFGTLSIRGELGELRTLGAVGKWGTLCALSEMGKCGTLIGWLGTVKRLPYRFYASLVTRLGIRG